MISLENLSGFIVTRIDFPFWEIIIKSTLTMALAALACQLLGRHSAALRHRVWAIGLAAALLVPLASVLLPQFMLPVLPSKAPSLTARKDTQPTGTVSVADSPMSDVSLRPVEKATLPQTAAKDQRPVASADSATTEWHVDKLQRGATAPLRFEQLLGFIWLAVTGLSASWFAMVLIAHRMWLGRLMKIEDADWVAAVTSAAAAIGWSRPIETRQCDDARVPTVAGILTPRLVIPANWRTWSQNQRHCVLLHELAHIKRRDVAVQLFGRMATIVYWFNPLVWYAVRQLRAERELASDDCVLKAGQVASDYAEQLLSTLRAYRPARLALGVAMAHTARLDQRVLAILDPHRARDAVGLRVTFLLSSAAVTLICTLGTLSLGSYAGGGPAQQSDTPATTNAGPVWLENYAVEFPGSLPVSVVFSPDGDFLLAGDTSGEVMALILKHEAPTYRWKTKVGGSHAAVAYSADQSKIYATTKDGVCILDAATGKEEERIDVADSNPIAVGVFPDRRIAEGAIGKKIAFGNSRGYFVDSWVEGKLADTRGTVETRTVSDNGTPADEAAVPLAVDPEGRSAIMTGPVDASGQFGAGKGKNVLWAYVCGDYDQGSPGNRILVGHEAPVVAAAWAKDGSTAVTGDAAGRVIIWDAKTMKESRRLELGGRVAALAISDDATRTAAYVLGKQGEVYVWDTAKSVEGMKPIHTELGDFAGSHAYASLAFSPDGQRLAGAAFHKKWLARLGELIGKVRLWELAAHPKAQVAPRHSYIKELGKENSANFVLLNNESLLMPADKVGAVDLRRIADGLIQARIVLGNFAIGDVKISSDRKWLAIAQHALSDERAAGATSSPFDVGIYAAPILFKATIPACSDLLDIASSGKAVAVVRDHQIQMWDTATAQMVKKAPFEFTQIDAAAFSPDGQLLAISDRSELVLWSWEEDTFERIELGRRVGSLAFSPDGKRLAEGPSPGEEIQIRSLESKKIVQTLTDDAGRAMDIARLAFMQGGRVLIACDEIRLDNQVPVPHRIVLWDTGDGSRAHQIEVAAGLPKNCAVSPNGRHLVAALEDGDGIKLSGWRLDGKQTPKEADGAPHAATPR